MLNLLKLLENSKPYLLDSEIGLQVDKIPVFTRNKTSCRHL